MNSIFLFIGLVLLLFGSGVVITFFKVKNKIEELIKTNKNIISENKKMINSFHDYQKNKYYEMALVYMNLKVYQEDLIKNMDLYMTEDMLQILEENINQIDIILKEIALLTPNIVKKQNIDFSIIQEIFLDKKSNFYKN